MVSGILYRPDAKFTGPRPVIVNIHGGPDTSERPRFQGRSNYILKELGVAMIFPNVRGSSGFGREFGALDDGKLRGNSVKDIGALLDWIATRPELDKNRVVLLGAELGWMARARRRGSTTTTGSAVSSKARASPISSRSSKTTDPARLANRRQEYGDERDPQMREFLLSLSPVTRAAELKKPTLIIQGGKDPRVPVGQAQELLKAREDQQSQRVVSGVHRSEPRQSRAGGWRLSAGVVDVVLQELPAELSRSRLAPRASHVARFAPRTANGEPPTRRMLWPCDTHS